MGNTDVTESVRRLERFAGAGRFDKVRKALDKGNPVLKEFGVSDARIREALTLDPPALEASGLMPPTMLEAIVRVTGRAPLVVRNGKVEGKTTLDEDFPANVDSLISGVEEFLPSVGRIEVVNHDMSWGGTGWVVGEDGPGRLPIVTNRHVATLVARRTFRGDGVFMFNPCNSARYGAEIDFGAESGGAPDPEKVFALEKFTYLADDEGGDGEVVAVVGYPAADPCRNDPNDMERYFPGPL